MDSNLQVTTVALGALTTALLLYYILTRKENKYPPGPLALPLIGNFPQLALYGSITKFAQHYRKIYGDVFTFTFGSNKRVVVSGYETFRELFFKNADYTSNRSAQSFLSADAQEIIQKTPGLFWAPFPHWKTLRSFTISTLREEGMGKSSMEPRIHEEVERYLSAFIEPNLDQPINVRHGLSQATCNIISQLLYAKRCEYDDENFNKMMDTIFEIETLSLKIAIVTCLPIPFASWFLKSAIDKEKQLTYNVLKPILQCYIDEHKVDLDRDNARDLTDRFLIHSQDVGEEESCFSEDNGWVLEFQLYIAGTDTTATTLRWLLLFMCLYPEVKAKVQEEIEREIGADRSPSCKDRVNMPYTDAVLLETLRRANIAPTALPHTMDRDATINGVFIPAGADLMLNMASVLYDETVFEEPEKFKPERYLTGDIALKKQRTIPFGIGRRVCLGESLAKMELFLFFTTFLQRYDVRVPEGAIVTEEPVETLLSSPQQYEIIFSRR